MYVPDREVYRIFKEMAEVTWRLMMQSEPANAFNTRIISDDLLKTLQEMVHLGFVEETRMGIGDGGYVSIYSPNQTAIDIYHAMRKKGIWEEGKLPWKQTGVPT